MPELVEHMIRLAFSRFPKELHEKLQMLELPGSRLACGCYLFAPPYLHVVIEARSQELNLGPADLIVTPQWEQAVLDQIKTLPKRYKVRITDSSINLHCKPERAVAEDVQQDGAIRVKRAVIRTVIRSNIQVERPFFHVPHPSSSVRSAPSDGPRTASTGVVHIGSMPRCST